jgi:hypothetical protein
MNELLHISLEIAGNTLLADRRRRRAASWHSRIDFGVEPARGVPQVLKQTGFKLLEVKIMPTGAAPVWDLDLRSNRFRQLFSPALLKCSACGFFMVACFES